MRGTADRNPPLHRVETRAAYGKADSDPPPPSYPPRAGMTTRHKLICSQCDIHILVGTRHVASADDMSPVSIVMIQTVGRDMSRPYPRRVHRIAFTVIVLFWRVRAAERNPPLHSYAMGSGQNWRRPQRVQCWPRQTLSNCSMAASIREGSLVRIPASKLRRSALFMPMPAPVRLAEPI